MSVAGLLHIIKLTYLIRHRQFICCILATAPRKFTKQSNLSEDFYAQTIKQL